MVPLWLNPEGLDEAEQVSEVEGVRNLGVVEAGKMEGKTYIAAYHTLQH